MTKVRYIEAERRSPSRNPPQVWTMPIEVAVHQRGISLPCHHFNESARQRPRDLWNTQELAQAQRQRKKVEALFAELKGRIGIHRLRLRRLRFVQEQFFLAATAQNIKRLVRFLGLPKASTAMEPA
jgi:hypothetical protein